MPLFVSIALSLLLAGAGVFLVRRSRLALPGALAFGTLLFLSFCIYVFYLVSDYFTGDGITDAVIYHVTYGTGGAGYGEYLGVIVTTTIALIAGLILSFVLPLFRRAKQPSRPFAVVVAFGLVNASALPNPAWGDLGNLLFYRSEFSDDFRQYYTRPYIRKKDGETKNLVFIWAEGLERTYFDEELFPGLITGLRDLETNGITFTNIRQVGATGYTVAGIIASQCGIPLLDSFYGNRMASMDAYLPNAVGVGDLLHREGYYLSYLGGAPLWFAGKGKFFTTHKFDEVLGREALLQRIDDSSYQNDWGLFDDSLLELTYERFIELSESGGHFGLFLLTLDTHHPNGHASRSTQEVIYGDGTNPMLNAVAASDVLLTGFIHKIRNSPYGRNTVVVVASDHLALRNSATDVLVKGDRRNLFMILDPDQSAPAQVDQLGSTLDIGPTLLPFLGFDGAIGLGRNLLAADLDSEEIAFIHNDENLRRWAKDFSSFWAFPTIGKSIELDPAASKMALDGRTFDIPALVKLDENWETVIEFPFNVDGSDTSLGNHVRNMPAGTPWLLFDHSEFISELHESIGKEGWCIVAGNGPEIYQVVRIEDHTSLSRQDIRALTGARKL